MKSETEEEIEEQNQSEHPVESYNQLEESPQEKPESE